MVVPRDLDFVMYRLPTVSSFPLNDYEASVIDLYPHKMDGNMRSVYVKK